MPTENGRLLLPERRELIEQLVKKKGGGIPPDCKNPFKRIKFEPIQITSGDTWVDGPEVMYCLETDKNRVKDQPTYMSCTGCLFYFSNSLEKGLEPSTLKMPPTQYCYSTESDPETYPKRRKKAK